MNTDGAQTIGTNAIGAERRKTGTVGTKARRAPMWMLLVFGLGTVVSLYVAGGFGGALAISRAPVGSGSEIVIVEFAFLGTTAFFLIQATALAGLYWRQHWAKMMAIVASALWAITLVGIPFSAVIIWMLVKRFRRRGDWAASHAFPKPPRSAYLLTMFGALLAYPWALFVYFLPYQLHELVPAVSVGDFGPTVAPLAYLSLPFFVVMVVATIGLRQNKDWGTAMAAVACVLFILTGIGALAGIPVLRSLWIWSRPSTTSPTPIAA